MIQSTLASLIRDNVTYTRLSICIFIVGIMGIGLQKFEPYAMFYILFPVLLIMLSAIVLILRYCLKELQNFRIICECNQIMKYCASLFPEKSSPLLVLIYIIMVGVYFVCIYRLQFVEINLMGTYILLFGGATFFLALIGYEICVRLTIALKEAERNIQNIAYDRISPKDTSWLQQFFRFHIILKNTVLIISMLFVLENSMLFVANYEKLDLPNLSDAKKLPILLKSLPIEWWVIWMYIFITIVLALPFMTWFRNKSINKIISYIQSDFETEMRTSYKLNDLKSDPQKYYFILNIMRVVQNSLKETYIPHSIDRFISLGASLLTCFAHFISFCMMLIPNFLK